MAFYKTKGIVLGSQPFDETGKLVKFFTSDHGKIRVIAKGAKRPTSKFGGRIETFSLLELMIAEGRNLDILSQCGTIESFQKLRESEAFINTGFYFIRVIDAATVERQKNQNLFKLLAFSLKKLKEGVEILKVITFFEVNFLRVEGIFRKSVSPDILIGEHLDVDVRTWKK
ncbi:MAG: DNA repair protein RecO [Candidatus Margulisiibacteriota bacterium]